MKSNTKISSYLTFNGNCKEAMTFYKDCLGGELILQKVGESPFSEEMSEKMRESILHSVLIKGELKLMGSDMVGEQGLLKGNAVSLMLECSSEEEIRSYYRNLSMGGRATHPLHLTHWGALFGDLTDKYGNQWILHFNYKKETETVHH